MKPVVINSPDQNKERKRLDKSNNFEEFKLDDSLKSIGKDKLYYLYTYGCQGNESDSEKIRGLMEEMSFTITYDLDKTDVILMNTCAIRKNAEDKVFGEIGRLKQLKRRKPELIVGLCGCMAQEESVVRKLLTKYQNVDFIFGTHNLHSLPSLIKRVMENKERVVDVLSYEGDIVENIPMVRESKIKAWVPIMYGCDEFCTYCIVPYTRGKERSRLPENIIKEVEGLISEGYKEITLLGQNVNAYGKDFVDLKYDFADLLTDLSKLSIPRIRFTTNNPKDFDDRQIEAIKNSKNIMPAIHLPVQSGSNKVLKKMNRKYTKESFIELCDKLYDAIPGVSITTDIIVAFPYETEEDFNETLELVKRCNFEGAYTFIFSPREGTPAAKYIDPSITEEVAYNRLYKLNDLVNEGYGRGNKRFLGQTVKVLIEGYSKNQEEILMGYTENNKLVNVVGDKKYIGQIVDVEITGAKTWSLDGRIKNS
ncbi:tRNA (N6-isopentenyl adenosine(37)-C2)-methylthiotransferase MiaB [bacterium]|nr:tRNA (N6-isopentenyl adenosine(37)-C2)-methylthiotransferase MiaB [bacterium]